MDMESVQPMMLKLELKTILSISQNLDKNLSDLATHASALGMPNENTENSLRYYTKQVDILEQKISKMYDRFQGRIAAESEQAIERAYCVTSSLRTKLAALHEVCSNATTLPKINASILKNLRIPELIVSKFKSPGFYVQLKNLQLHVRNNPFTPKYYAEQVLEALKKNENTIYTSLTLGKVPESINEIIQNIATVFLPPKVLEAQAIGVLKDNGRLSDPVQPTNIKKNTEAEITKRTTVQSILLNCQAMYDYFNTLHGSNSGFESYIQAGIFNSNFCNALLETMPPTDKLSILRATKNLDFRSQIQYYFNYNNESLTELFLLRNMSSQDVFSK